jgi:hypothetical protein
MPVYYKDFDKDVKDLLTKQFVGKDGPVWKVESKVKGPKDQVYINPIADGKGVTVDVQYDCGTCGLKTKANVDSNLNIKPKFTYEVGAHKIEASTTSDVRDLNYEVTYDMKEKGYSGSIKVTPRNLEGAAVISVAHHCVVGFGAVHDLTGKAALSWSLGTRYNMQGAIVHALTTALKTYDVGVLKTVNLIGQPCTVAAQYKHSAKPEIIVGLETACVLCPMIGIHGNVLKLRVNSNLNVGVAIIRKFADNWKAALSYEYGPKVQFGLLLTRE